MDPISKYDRLIYTIAAERIAGSQDWDDAIQEARIEVWQLHQQGKIPKDGRSVTGWVATVIRRTITSSVQRQLWTSSEPRKPHGHPADPLRTPAAERGSLDDPDLLFDAPSPETLQTVELAYHYGEIVAAINSLPANQREYVVARFWGGMTGAEIAARQGRPLGTVDREWVTKIRPALSLALQHLQPAGKES